MYIYIYLQGLISEVATSTEPGAANLGQLDSDSKSSKDFYNVCTRFFLSLNFSASPQLLQILA